MNQTDQTNQMNQMNQSAHRWSYLSTFFQNPDLAASLTGPQFLELLDKLDQEGVLPLFAHQLHQRPAYQSLSPDLRECLSRAVLPYVAASTALWHDFGKVIDHLSRESLHPVLIKGSHLALCYYERPYLRPMADIDLLFLDLRDAERAYALLFSQGYLCRDPSRGGDRWLWSRHLPELQAPQARHHHVELHGSVVYSPRDRRHLQERVLLEPLDSIAYGLYRLHAPIPEAAVIFALAHELVRHAADPPRMIVLHDVCAILQKLGPRFDWNRLLHLARESGFADSTASGLSAASRYLGVGVPEQILNELEQGKRIPSASHRVGPSQQAKLTQLELASYLHVRSLRLLLQKLGHMLFPSHEYMRVRYPQAKGVPLAFLYPYRWLIQIAKVTSFLVESLFRPHDQTNEMNEMTKGTK